MSKKNVVIAAIAAAAVAVAGLLVTLVVTSPRLEDVDEYEDE